VTHAGARTVVISQRFSGWKGPISTVNPSILRAAACGQLACTEASSTCALGSVLLCHLAWVAEMFVALDVDQSGGLSKAELRAFNDDNLTDIFIERGT